MPIGVVSDEEFNLELKNNTKTPLSNPYSKLPDKSSSELSEEEFVPLPSKFVPLQKIESQPIEPVAAEVINSKHKGRQVNDVNVPDALRKIIGETSEINGRSDALELAKHFDISPSSVSAYANGSTSTASYDKPKQSMRDHINRTKERIGKRAQNRLMAALEHITPEKMIGAKVRDLAAVAKDMSTIMKDVDPNFAVDSNTPKFIIYSPSFKKEEHFETIIINE